MGLATVDFALFLHGTEEQKETAAALLVNSYRHCGFVRLVNHEIPLSMIEKAEEWVCEHSSLLSTDEKISLALLTTACLITIESIFFWARPGTEVQGAERAQPQSSERMELQRCREHCSAESYRQCTIDR